MNGLFEAALEIQDFIERRQWRFCIIGGLAVVRWGEPQVTQDVDISLLTGFGNERPYVEEILKRFDARIADADQFALDTRVLLVSASNGVAIDVALAAIPFEEEIIRRASRFAFTPDVALLTCSAEDLVILKAFAGRTKDWAAVEGILICRGRQLDWDYIQEHLPALAELRGDPGLLRRLEELRKDLETE